MCIRDSGLSHSFHGSQPHGDRAAVALALGVVGELRDAGQQLELGGVLRKLHGKPRRRGRAASAGEQPLDEAVLERLVRHDHRAAAGVQQVERGGDRALERGELAVHLDAQRLEDALRRMALILHPGRGGLLQHLDQLQAALDGRLGPRGDDRPGVCLLYTSRCV